MSSNQQRKFQTDFFTTYSNDDECCAQLMSLFTFSLESSVPGRESAKEFARALLIDFNKSIVCEDLLPRFASALLSAPVSDSQATVSALCQALESSKRYSALVHTLSLSDGSLLEVT